MAMPHLSGSQGAHTDCWQVWNVRSGACVRTMHDVTHGLAGMFAPGNRHALVGCKVGSCAAGSGIAVGTDMNAQSGTSVNPEPQTLQVPEPPVPQALQYRPSMWCVSRCSAASWWSGKLAPQGPVY